MKLAFVGESWGEAEECERMPFVGPAGWQFNSQLKDAGISRHECYITNVFNLRPRPTNKVENLCAKRAEVRHNLPPLKSGHYIRDEYLGEIDRLYREIGEVRPNLVVALGGTATWAFLHDSRITKLRGTIASSVILPGQKVLPTFHPSYILQGGFDQRHVVILDLMKAKRECEFPEVRRPQRVVYTEPVLSELNWFFEKFIAPAKLLSVDIETQDRTITCIGFAPSRETAMVVPFRDFRKERNCYWPTLDAEVEAWRWVRKVLRTPIPKLFQNGLYDINFLWREYRMTAANATHDTMLLHHALQPEAPKGLGFLGSIYTDEAAWKLGMRQRFKGTIKREE